jgi:hypothetical protein
MSSYHVSDSRKGLTQEELDAELACFQKHFPGKRLLALQLDGFSHYVVYDDGSKQSVPHYVEVSFCCSEGEWLGYCHDDEKRAEAKAARAFLKEIGHTSHACYQNNATEIIYVRPEER